MLTLWLNIRRTSVLKGFVSIAVVTMALAGSALAQGDADVGASLVTTWCTGCHVVDDDGHGADIGPPLPALLRDGQRTSDEIRGWLADPHPPMPNFDLTRQEIEDIVAHLERLAAQ
jgi:mono/diheme cytochrome c family protein